MNFDPTQETWRVSETHLDLLVLPSNQPIGQFAEENLDDLRGPPGDTPERTDRFARDDARARLASAAPDMARVLLAVEWLGFAEGCPECGASKSDPVPYMHNGDCALDLALRKAGVRP